MLALYCTDRRLTERLRAALPAAERVVAAGDWGSFESAAPAATCSVVVVEWLGDGTASHQLATFKLRHPLQPVVLVTRRDADNVRHLTELRVEEVIWPGEVDERLWPTVARARATGLLHRLAMAFEAAALPLPLRAALAHACRADPPVRSVSHLARVAGCDRRTLWRWWRRVRHDAPELRLEDVLHWLLLLRAVGGKVPGQGWSAVAAELGVHEHTLGRLAHRFTGRTLRELAAEGQPAVLARFVRCVLRPLLGEGAGDAFPDDR